MFANVQTDRASAVPLLAALLTYGCSEPPAQPLTPSAQLFAAVGAAAEVWTYEVLGNPAPPNVPAFSVEALNDSGDVTGVAWPEYYANGPVEAWRWRKGVFQTTKGGAGPDSWAGAYGINNHGDIFGTSSPDKVNWQATAWRFGPGGGVVGFVGLTPGARVEGADINDHGYAIGDECGPKDDDGYCQPQVLLWRPKQAAFPWFPQVVGLGPVGEFDRAVAINNDAMAIGHTTINYGDDRAWISLENGSMELLPLGGDYDASWPGDINDGLITVGVAETRRDRRYRFVYWIGASLPIDLGIPQDADDYPNVRAPVRVSNEFRIAANANEKPFTFKDGVMTELPVPNGATAEVSDINTCGTIVGTVSYIGPERYLIRWQRTMNGQIVCDTPPRRQ